MAEKKEEEMGFDKEKKYLGDKETANKIRKMPSEFRRIVKERYKNCVIFGVRIDSRCSTSLMPPFRWRKDRNLIRCAC